MLKSSLVFVAVTLAMTPALATAKIVPVSVPSIIAVGDSITAEGSAPIAWPELIPIWNEVPIVNQGESGDTTAQMLDRFPAALASPGQMVILMGGANDCAHDVPTPDTVGNIAAMVDQTLAAGKQAAIIGPIPRQHPTSAGAVSSSCLLPLRSALRSYAASRHIRFIDPWPSFTTKKGAQILSLFEDGTHPNARGAFTLARVVAATFGWTTPAVAR